MNTVSLKVSILFFSGLLLISCSGNYKNTREELLNTKPEFIQGTSTFNSLDKVLEKVEPVIGGMPSSHDGRTLVIFFNSECDHCQKEASELAGHLDKLSNEQIWWISFEEPEVMKSFLNEKGVTQHPKTHAFYIEPEEARDLLGFLGMPQTMVYDSKGLLDAYLGPITYEEKLQKFFE